MHILHIEEFFIPNLGYQINLLTKFMASKQEKITILTTKLDKIPSNQKVYLKKNIDAEDAILKQKYNIDIIRLPINKVISNRAIWPKSTLKHIKEINPDFVYLHNNDSFIAIVYLRFYLKKLNKPLILDSHMVFEASINRLSKIFRFLYRKFITPIIVKNDLLVIKLVDVDFLQKAYGIPNDNTPLLSFGSDTTIFNPYNHKSKKILDKYGLQSSAKIYIYAGKLSEDKNGLFLANSLKEKFDFDEEVIFIIVGDTVGEYGNLVEQSFSYSKNKIIRLPLQEYINLAELFSISDFGIIPTGGSLTFYDMQASGLPIIWSDLPMNTIRSDSNRCLLFKANEIKDFRHKIIESYYISKDNYLLMRDFSFKYIFNNYDYSKVCDDYLELIYSKRVLKKWS